MKRLPTLFLQLVVVLLGLGVLAFLILEPLREGRNINATLFQVYFHDAFLAYAYTASIAFFVALYKAFRLLGYIGNGNGFSLPSVQALQTIKYCALTIAGFIVLGEILFVLPMRGQDDIAGGVAMGLMITSASVVVAATAYVLEKLFQSALERK